MGLKVAFLTDHRNQQGDNGKEEIHYTSYTHHHAKPCIIMINQHFFLCFICHLSIRVLRSLCTSLFKAKMIKRKPSMNLLSAFHLCRAKGQIYLLSDRLFLLAFRHPLLKIWGAGGKGEKVIVSLTFSKMPLFYTVLLQNHVVLASLLNETGMVGRSGSWKE